MICDMVLTSSRKGDYHRYLAEFASGPKRKGAATAAHEAYKVNYPHFSLLSSAFSFPMNSY